MIGKLMKQLFTLLISPPAYCTLRIDPTSCGFRRRISVRIWAATVIRMRLRRIWISWLRKGCSTRMPLPQRACATVPVGNYHWHVPDDAGYTPHALPGAVAVSIRPFTQSLREAGYYCTNNSKTDYQFSAPKDTWDQSSGKAHWRGQKGQPFFAVFNFTGCHESGIASEGKYKSVTQALPRTIGRRRNCRYRRIIRIPPWCARIGNGTTS